MIKINENYILNMDSTNFSLFRLRHKIYQYRLICKTIK